MTAGRRRAGFLAGAVAVCCAAVLLLAAPAPALEGSDWQHALLVAQSLRADPPDAPVVLLLGGSCAREATVSDRGWATGVERLVGGTVVARNLGSRNQTFEQDEALVKALPRAPMLIYIGVNRGRFTAAATATTSTVPRATKGTYNQHHYSAARVKSLAWRQEQVSHWMKVRYPVFDERFAANLSRLEALVDLCKKRGYHPVLLDLPRNEAIIGDAFAEPVRRYQDACRDLADREGVPYLDFVGDVGLVNEDFYDLDHLIESGRVKYQGRLVTQTGRLLRRFGMATARGGSADQSGLAATLWRRLHLPWILAVVALTAIALGVQRRRTVVRRRRAARRRRVAPGSPGRGAPTASAGSSRGRSGARRDTRRR